MGKKLGANAFVGKYTDPAHEGCERTISYIGGRSYQIDGADEDMKPWKVVGSRAGSAVLTVDFSPKGGPTAVPATQLPLTGDLKFPDGNVWKKSLNICWAQVSSACFLRVYSSHSESRCGERQRVSKRGKLSFSLSSAFCKGVAAYP